MSKSKKDPVPLAWIKLELFPEDWFENSVFGEEDQLIELFAASFKKYPFLVEVVDKAKELRQNNDNSKNN